MSTVEFVKDWKNRNQGWLSRVSSTIFSIMVGVGEIIGGFTGWKARLLSIALLIMVGGMILNSVRFFDLPSPSRASADSSMSNNWAQNSRKKIELKERGESWGNVAFRVGISFIAAMIFASLLRAFFKTMIVLTILSALVLWFLESQGMIEPVWDRLFASARDVGGWFSSQTNSVRQFLQGSLPSAGAAIVGFGLGLRR